MKATLCPNTQDIWIQYTVNNIPYTHWIPREEYIAQNLSGSPLTVFEKILPVAFASQLESNSSTQSDQIFTISQGNFQVICLKKLSETTALRRIQTSNGQCFDEIINTFTGEIVQSKPRNNCDSNCNNP